MTNSSLTLTQTTQHFSLLKSSNVLVLIKTMTISEKG